MNTTPSPRPLHDAEPFARRHNNSHRQPLWLSYVRLACILAVAAFPHASFAQGAAKKNEGYGYEFSDDPLNAGGYGPNDATTRVRPGPVRTTLVRPRTTFETEMLKSVENLFAPSAPGPLDRPAAQAVVVTQGVDPTTQKAGMVVRRYDNTTRTFVIQPLGAGATVLPTLRQFSEAAIEGGKVYLFFGTADGVTPLDEVWVNDLATDTWTMLATPASGPVPGARFGHVVLPLGDGRIFLHGGITAPFAPADANAWIYDPATNTWTQGAVPPLGAGFGSDARVLEVNSSDKVVLIGAPGDSATLRVLLYDPVADTWTEAGGPPAVSPSARVYFGLHSDGQNVKVLGGRLLRPTSAQDLTAEVWKFDLETSTWERAADLPDPMAYLHVVDDIVEEPGQDPVWFSEITVGQTQDGSVIGYLADAPIFGFKALAHTGTQVPGEPAGTLYADLSLPGGTVFLGSLRSGPRGKPLAAIFDIEGKVSIRVGDAAPGVAGTQITTLGQPSGHTVLATLRDRRTALLADLDHGLDALPPLPVRTAAITGQTVAGTLLLKSFVSVDGTSDVIFFLAKVAGPGVNAGNDSALFAALGDGTVLLLCREGQQVGGKTVSVLATLVAAKDSLAEGRWRCLAAGRPAIAVRLTFPDKTHALYAIPFDAANENDWVLYAQTGDAAPGTAGGTIAELGLPGMGGARMAFLARATGGDADRTDDQLLYVADAGSAPVLLARENGRIENPETDLFAGGVVIRTMADPVASGKDGGVSVLATLAGPDAGAKTRTALCRLFDDGRFKLALRTGDTDADDGEAPFASVTGVTVPDGAAARTAFLAHLTQDRRKGIDAARDACIALAGELKGVILEEGQILRLDDGTERTVRSFEALKPAVGSLGANRGTQGIVIWALVTFTDRTKAVIPLTTPL